MLHLSFGFWDSSTRGGQRAERWFRSLERQHFRQWDAKRHHEAGSDGGCYLGEMGGWATSDSAHAADRPPFLVADP